MLSMPKLEKLLMQIAQDYQRKKYFQTELWKLLNNQICTISKKNIMIFDILENFIRNTSTEQLQQITEAQ
ncbi:14258_t:CDS:2, partial [Dentiscutata erythropus]